MVKKFAFRGLSGGEVRQSQVKFGTNALPPPHVSHRTSALLLPLVRSEPQSFLRCSLFFVTSRNQRKRHNIQTCQVESFTEKLRENFEDPLIRILVRPLPLCLVVCSPGPAFGAATPVKRVWHCGQLLPAASLPFFIHYIHTSIFTLPLLHTTTIVHSRLL
jgi:hypothetical protein